MTILIRTKVTNSLPSSDSNIQQFSCYFKQLPELEIKMNGKVDNE